MFFSKARVAPEKSILHRPAVIAICEATEGSKVKHGDSNAKKSHTNWRNST